MPRPEPKPESVRKIREYAQRYWEKSGTTAHPLPEVTEAVIAGLAANLDEVGGRFALATSIRTSSKKLKSTAGGGCARATK